MALMNVYLAEAQVNNFFQTFVAHLPSPSAALGHDDKISIINKVGRCRSPGARPFEMAGSSLRRLCTKLPLKSEPVWLPAAPQRAGRTTVRVAKEWPATCINTRCRTLSPGALPLGHNQLIQAENPHQHHEQKRNRHQSSLPTRIQDRFVHLRTPRLPTTEMSFLLCNQGGYRRNIRDCSESKVTKLPPTGTIALSKQAVHTN